MKKRVRCIQTGKVYDNLYRAARDTGVDYSNLRKLLVLGVGRSINKLSFEYVSGQEEEISVAAEPALPLPLREVSVEQVEEEVTTNESDVLPWLRRP